MSTTPNGQEALYRGHAHSLQPVGSAAGRGRPDEAHLICCPWGRIVRGGWYVVTDRHLGQMLHDGHGTKPPSANAAVSDGFRMKQPFAPRRTASGNEQAEPLAVRHLLASPRSEAEVVRHDRWWLSFLVWMSLRQWSRAAKLGNRASSVILGKSECAERASQNEQLASC